MVLLLGQVQFLAAISIFVVFFAFFSERQSVQVYKKIERSNKGKGKVKIVRIWIFNVSYCGYHDVGLM